MRVVLVLLVLATSVAMADPNPEAQKLLDEGTRLFTEDANHQAAREAFQKSYELEPSWRALNGVALTYVEQGRFVDALDTYDQLQREFDALLTETQRSTVTARVARLLAQVAVVEIRATQPSATVMIDNLEIGTAPLAKSVRLLPGKHVVVATLAGHQTMTRTIEVAAGQHVPIEITLAPERVIVRTRPVQLARRFPRRTPWVIGAIGLGAIAIGGAFHALSARHFDRFDATVESTSGSPPMAVAGDIDLHDRAVLERRFAYGGYLLGGLAVIAGGVLLGLNQPRPISVEPAKHGATVVVRF